MLQRACAGLGAPASAFPALARALRVNNTNALYSKVGIRAEFMYKQGDIRGQATLVVRNVLCGPDYIYEPVLQRISGWKAKVRV